MSISFIVTNFNTKKYTEWCYNSIRKNLGYKHEIVMLDDGSVDGTWELLQELKSTDINMKIHRNEKNIGIAYAYNKMVDLATNEIVCMLHSDMYVPPKFDEIMLKYMEEYDFITPLRVEPDVGYPSSVDKLLINFGTQSENFDENAFINWHEENIEKNKGRTEQRMFFPWMTTKTLYNNVGGNDELFLKYMVDDDDFYLRIKMAGGKYTQLFETAVYHMPSKSVRMREDNLQVDVDLQYSKSLRNFVRKWGVWPGEVWDENRDMVIPKKYDIAFNVSYCNIEHIQLLEPICSNLYIHDMKLILEYSKNYIDDIIHDYSGKYDLTGRVLSNKRNISNDIIVSFNAKHLNEERLGFLQKLSDIITHSGEIGKMKYDIFTLDIRSLNTYEHDNLFNENRSD
tara:strand:+ start:309 stop:1502 length:1194 start_codon:yes stop_codon:yes gene_type:complete